MVLIARPYAQFCANLHPEASTFFAEKDKRMETQTAELTRPLLHKREIAALRLGISLRTLDDLIASRQIASVKIKKRRLVSEEAIQAFIHKAEKSKR
jgi:excisionase family DNA binding protein